MLDTVLQIGKAFRESKEAIKHHRYIRACPRDTDKEKVLRLSIPIRKDFSFDLENITEITDQNEYAKLYFLRFKTADADGLVKYIYGDVFFQIVNGEERDYYRMADLSNKQKAYQKSSFGRGESDFHSLIEKYKKTIDDINVSRLLEFRKSFEHNISQIERLLKYQVGVNQHLKLIDSNNNKSILTLLNDENDLIEITSKTVFSSIVASRSAKKTFKKILDNEKPNFEELRTNKKELKKLCNYSTGSIFLHFDFDGKHWYEFENDLEAINDKLLEDFSEELPDQNGYILKKYIYKTLSSAEKDLQFPQFTEKSRFKSKVFSKLDEINDLLYAINYSRSPLLSVYKSKMRIVVLPKGYNLEARDYLNFNKGLVTIENEPDNEDVVTNSNEIELESDVDPLFANITEKAIDKIIQFDVIFSKQGEKGKQDDLLELSGIEKSLINYLSQRITRIKIELQDQRQKQFKSTALKPLSIYYSFLNILGDATTEKKKYQNHLYKILPQVYSGTYLTDPLLLPALIEKTEYNVRNGDSNYSFLKYDFYFLTKIQNTIIEGENLMKILESQSYKVGLLLGRLSLPLKSVINSFEKNYVGNLTRKITSISDLIKYQVEVNQKLLMHDKAFPDKKQTSLELTDSIKSFTDKFDKNEFALGFFESYFASFQSKENTKIEELIITTNN
ncbi:MAG: hypothetical protein FD122_1289 [Stygiobacter sp.]|nr:MAG: hypothetical protein FD122_1289 [Stygiobacter sp.]KAF0218132.1 MAG: hypothetical protein FD178_12 [Ignavibacteria bacterium]